MKRINIIKEVLEKLNTNNVSYCILRNYDFLIEEREPIKDSEKSIDLVVTEKDYPHFSKILKSLNFRKRKQQFSLKHKAFFKINDNLETVSFDVQVGGVHWNDMCYLHEDLILKNKIMKSFFYVPNNNDTFIMLLVHSILGKRFFKPEYQKILHHLISVINFDNVKKELSKIFNKNIAEKLLGLIKENQFDKIDCYPLIFLYLIKKPKHFFIFTSLSWRYFLQRKNPFRIGPLISILGPDGSGKSTMVRELNNYLIQQNRKTSIIYTGRGRDHILPITNLGRSYKKKEKDSYGDKEKQLVKKTSFKVKLIYTLAAPVFTLDLYLRYWFRIFPQRFKKKIVITDRYCSDIILMRNVPFFFKRILLSLFPKPTLSIYLHNDAGILHQRRPEEPIIELDRQMEIFNQFNYSLILKTDHKNSVKKKIIDYTFSRLLHDWR